MAPNERRLRHLLRRQSGVITTVQAVELGMSRSTVRDRVRSGHWRRIAPRVYLSADREFTDEVRLRAAVYSAGSLASAHGLSAAWWHQLVPTLPATVDMTVPRTCAPTRRTGVRLRRRDLAAGDRVEIRDLWVTELPLSVLEAAATDAGGSVLLDRALQGRVSMARLWAAHQRNEGRYGSSSTVRMLAAAADGAASEAERILVRLLREAGITGWVLGYRRLGYVIDLAFPAARVAVEVDGWAWHHDATQFQRDRARQNVLVNDGWLVLRFTWHDLTARPAEAIAQIRQSLATSADSVR